MHLYYLPQYKLTTLNQVAGINAVQTTGIVVADLTNIDITKPGIVAMAYANPLNLDTVEYIGFTSISAGGELQGVTRDLEGTGAHSYDHGAVMAFVYSKSHQNTLADAVADIMDGSIFYGADAGSNDTYAVTVNADNLTAYAAGMRVIFKANTANTGAATLNVNALGAKDIKKNVTEDLADGDIAANQLVEVVYDGTNFQLLQASVKNLTTPVVKTAHSLGVLGATVTIQGKNGDLQQGTLAENITITLSLFAGQRLTLFLLQDGSGTNTISFADTIVWQNAETPEWTTTASKMNVMVIYYDGSAYYGMGGKFA